MASAEGRAAILAAPSEPLIAEPFVEIIIGIGVLIGYLVLQIWVLPRMGVST